VRYPSDENNDEITIVMTTTRILARKSSSDEAPIKLLKLDRGQTTLSIPDFLMNGELEQGIYPECKRSTTQVSKVDTSS